MSKVTAYKDIYGKEPLGKSSIEQYVKATKEGRWKEVTENARAMLDKHGKGKEYDQAKNKSPFITMSASFEGRRGNNEPHTHSGLILMDIDVQDNEQKDIDAFPDAAMLDEYINVYHKSIGGKGYAIIFKINPEKHLESFQAISKYLKDTYGLVADPACKDISRGRFCSYDPELFYQFDSLTFDGDILNEYKPKDLPKKKVSQVKHTAKHGEIMDIAQKMVANDPNIIDGYDEFIRVGFSLAAGLGESGRDIYHTLCSPHAKYDQKTTDTQYDNCLATFDPNVSTMGTFYFYAKKAGVKIIGQNRIEPKKGEVPSEVLKRIKEKVELMPKRPNADEAFEMMKLYVDSLGLIINEVSDRIEYKGKDIPEKFEKIIAAKLRTVMPPSTVIVRRIEEMIDGITLSYNPIKDYFDVVGNKPSEGVIDKLLSYILLSEQSPEELKPLIKKWLVSMVATVYDNKAELVLVLSGKQGCGKSTFFDHLLPEPLQKFYANGTFEQGARGNELTLKMQEKLLYVNDEMSGFKHSDWKKFKAAVSSTNAFEREAYGRRAKNIRRLAVFGGSTNEFHYMSDETGNRRIIPANMDGIKYDEYLALDKEALFSELIAEYLADPEYSWRLTREETQYLIDISEANRFKFDDEVLIEEMFRPIDEESDKDCCYFMSASQVAEVLGIKNSSLKKYQSMHIGQTLNRLGFHSCQRRVFGKMKKGYHIEDRNGELAIMSGAFGFDHHNFKIEKPAEFKTKATKKDEDLKLPF